MLAARVPAALLERTRATWIDRCHTELRSVQIMNRFLGELLAAGEPLDVCELAHRHVGDEMRHVRLCTDLVRALGAEPTPPPPRRDGAGFATLAPDVRALVTAVSMLAVSETLSVAFIRDLQSRCDDPDVRAVLDATLDDEGDHEGFGWDYVAKALARRPDHAGLARDAAAHALAPHKARIAQHLGSGSRLEDDGEPELARWGLFSPRRQALVASRALARDVLPRLERAGIA